MGKKFILFFYHCFLIDIDMEYFIPCLIAFFAYSFAASGIYCFNDIYDIEDDKKHPKKSALGHLQVT